ncbi:hypothetical protein CLV30_10829 [Haloactinopolyspora alba]|uniref:Polymerase nucleotidyl transferase domain-containing protein n=1 Tax=Haloactinopolyspora alba TaxID=648780 RepID=A0A2P8E132_9ACTN|nr:nucleotidyltransferase domain-containing protein [Haloactinopolyspora alba]PSL03117.1 hypothetical protein CLV30_10829 [Haloactinopolyspora alba]
MGSIPEVDRDRLAEICERYGVAELDVFGSVARGDDTPQSDIDLLYVLRPDAKLGWAIEDLNDELDELFGRHVDLISKRYINRRLRASILAEARLMYAAA